MKPEIPKLLGMAIFQFWSFGFVSDFVIRHSDFDGIWLFATAFN